MPDITITIKRRLKNLSKDTKQYLLDNMYRRHYLYNKSIEILLRESENNSNITAYDIAKILYHEVEKIDPDYGYYATGIREQVANSIFQMMNKMKYLSNHPNPYVSSKYDTIYKRYRFHKFIKYHQSFSMNCKVTYYPSGKYSSKIYSLDNNTITVRFNKNTIKSFEICEESFNNKNHPYVFHNDDVKMIHFLYKNGNFYILLVTKVNSDYCIPLEQLVNRKALAGVDLGETNPVALSNNGVYTDADLIKFPDKVIEDIDKRIDRLQSHLDHKIFRSNNYDKLLEKINRLKERQANIRLDWRYKEVYKLVTSYSILEVDTFYVNLIRHGSDEWLNMPAFNRKAINRKLKNRAMGYFQTALIHMANKYECFIDKPSIPTTRICHICQHTNPHPALSTRILTCECCGSKFDRDINASINCYIHGLVKFFGYDYYDETHA